MNIQLTAAQIDNIAEKSQTLRLEQYNRQVTDQTAQEVTREPWNQLTGQSKDFVRAFVKGVIQSIEQNGYTIQPREQAGQAGHN